MLTNSLQMKDPLGYPYFRLTVTRSNLYVNSLRRLGTQWIGLMFHYQPIQCRIIQYRVTNLWNEHEEVTIWEEVDKNVGFHTKTSDGNPSYNWSQLHNEFMERGHAICSVQGNVGSLICSYFAMIFPYPITLFVIQSYQFFYF